jgi:hypothetical protein
MGRRIWMATLIIGLGALSAMACTQGTTDPMAADADSMSSPAVTSPLATTVSLDYASMTDPCGFTAPPPTPTPGPPTPPPTPLPTSPFSEADFPPYIELPSRPTPELPAQARPLAGALVSVAIHPPADYDSPVSHATGLLVSADGLVLTVLDYTRPVDRIEVVPPDGGTQEASIEKVDARTGATLLKLALSDGGGIEGLDLPYAEIGPGDPSVSSGEPVLLLRQHPVRGEAVLLEGFASPNTDEITQDTRFALLPIGNRGGNGALVVNREGRLLGMVGPHQWWGTAILWGGPSPGPPWALVRATSLLSLLEADLAERASSLPAAISYHGQNWAKGIDSPVNRDLLSGPAQIAMNSLGGPAPVENLGQEPRSILGYGPGTVLELVYPHPQELRASGGEFLGQARYVAFWWDREDGKPDMVLCGAQPGRVGAAFLAEDLTELKTAVASAPVLGRSTVDFDPLPGYPDDYHLTWRLSPNKDTYHTGEEVEFTVTIKNQTQWPISAHPVPPALEVRQVGGPGPVPWWQHLPEDANQVIPAQQEMTLVIPWPQVDHNGNPVPPGEYGVSALYNTASGPWAVHNAGRFTIREE